MIVAKGDFMIRFTIASLVLFAVSCTVNLYDHSTHGGSGGAVSPDTVYIEHSPPSIGNPPVPPVHPDTVFSRYPLIGGSVEVEEAGTWKRHTLRGCISETDGVLLEIIPVAVYRTAHDGSISKEFSVVFSSRLQAHVFETQSSGGVSFGLSQEEGTGVLPVVTGTEFLRLVADRTTYPFLLEESTSYEGRRLPDGNMAYSAVFDLPDWKLRSICSAGSITAAGSNPEFRLMFSDDARRLLQQFYDIFVVHNGQAPVLPVGGGAASVTN
jgi:hypothetical protein